MSETPNTTASPAPAEEKKRLVAVIDIGATAIRMEIAEINEAGEVRTVDALRQGIPLGKDTFTKGHIEQSTIRECVKIMRDYKRVLDEYGITHPEDIKAVATSSVREADNRDTVLDRIYMATGINARAIDEAEESRLTYMAVQSIMDSQPDLKESNALVVDIGGGSTEVLLIEKGHVTFSNSYRLGSLRMRETLETQRATTDRVRTILGQHIQRTVEQITRGLPVSDISTLVAMSGDARFAAAQISPDWDESDLARIDYKTFSTFVEKLLPMTAQKIVSKYHITYQEAEIVGPALLVTVHLARAFKVENMLIPRASLRDGLLKEMTLKGYWTTAFAGQVIHSARVLGEKYDIDYNHARHVADLTVTLFDALKPEHQLSDRCRVLLEVAALVHEVGGYVSSRSHHKHSYYLILNSDLFGLTRDDMAIIALVSRYHRRALPKPTHEPYMALNRDDRLAVSKMSAILRVADALDRGHIQNVKDLSFSREGEEFVITVSNVEDLTVERMAMKEKANLFQEVYGMQVVLREARVQTGDMRDGP